MTNLLNVEKMMDSNSGNKFDYYTAPPQHIFDDIRRNAEVIWRAYDDTHGYAAGKLERIDIQNVSDNAWYIVAMFDAQNQEKLLKLVSAETAEMIRLARGS